MGFRLKAQRRWETLVSGPLSEFGKGGCGVLTAPARLQFRTKPRFGLLQFVELCLKSRGAEAIGDRLDQAVELGQVSSSSRRLKLIVSSASRRCRLISAWNSLMNSATKSGCMRLCLSASRISPSRTFGGCPCGFAGAEAACGATRKIVLAGRGEQRAAVAAEGAQSADAWSGGQARISSRAFRRARCRGCR